MEVSLPVIKWVNVHEYARKILHAGGERSRRTISRIRAQVTHTLLTAQGMARCHNEARREQVRKPTTRCKCDVSTLLPCTMCLSYVHADCHSLSRPLVKRSLTIAQTTRAVLHAHLLAIKPFPSKLQEATEVPLVV